MNPELKYKGNQVWDAFRQKWIVNTPEEEVRQYIAWYLHQDLGYPKSWIAMERSLKHREKVYRFDLVLFGADAKPLILVECKAPQISLNQKVFDQIFKYNIVLQIPYLMVTNGHQNYALHLVDNQPEFIAQLPAYSGR